MKTIVKSVWAFVVAGMILVGGAAVTGCETTKGVGRDVENAGDKIEDVAD